MSLVSSDFYREEDPTLEGSSLSRYAQISDSDPDSVSVMYFPMFLLLLKIRFFSPCLPLISRIFFLTSFGLLAVPPFCGFSAHFGVHDMVGNFAESFCEYMTFRYRKRSLIGMGLRLGSIHRSGFSLCFRL